MTTGKTVASLTVLWVLAVAALSVWLFTIGLGNWTAHFSNGADSTEGKQQEAMVTVGLAAVAVGGLGLIGLLAMSRRAFVTGTVYLVLALVAGVFAVTPVTEAFRTRTPAAPVAPGGGCQEHSGGDTRCPGG